MEGVSDGFAAEGGDDAEGEDFPDLDQLAYLLAPTTGGAEGVEQSGTGPQPQETSSRSVRGAAGQSSRPPLASEARGDLLAGPTHLPHGATRGGAARGSALSSARSGAAARGLSARWAGEDTLQSKTSRPALPSWSPALLGEGREAQAVVEEPVPVELLEERESPEAFGLDGDSVAAGVGSLLPPLPAMDGRGLAAPQEEASAGPQECVSGGAVGEEPPSRSEPSEVPLQPVLRGARSYRSRAAMASEGTLAEEQEAIFDWEPPQAEKANRGATLHASCRLVLAGLGDETRASSTRPTSSQSVRSCSWREEWTPGVTPAVPAPPPMLCAERLAVATAAALPRFQAEHRGSQRPPSGRGAGEGKDSSGDAATGKTTWEAGLEAALRRISQSGNANAALPPALPRLRRWASSSLANSMSGNPSRSSTPAQTGLGEAEGLGDGLGSATRASEFSELALSFATIDAVS